MQVDSEIRTVHDLVQAESIFVDDLLREASKVIVGQKRMIERLLLGLLTGGHVLLEGLPGLAKTLTVKTLASALDASFQRIQFTPDLLPADLIGTTVYNQATGAFTVRRGPIFANLILADEINRAPAKVQSALLEAMEERQVTIGEQTFPLPDPFVVMATQNPIEQEGTYPLPEAQMDRFMFHVKVGHPSREEERAILDRMGDGPAPRAQKVVEPARILRAREVVERIYVDPKVKDYVVSLVFASREPARAGLSEFEGAIACGASPRASLFLLRAAKAHAFLRHRGYVTPEDVKAVGMDVLRHRILLTFEAEAEQITAEDVVQRIFDRVEVP
ncbi:MAG TPA: AAA family ATPase [Fredinandcohnia sp.]|nr:AAA family ATPase [Fredinandcohnia sp.]